MIQWEVVAWGAVGGACFGLVSGTIKAVIRIRDRRRADRAMAFIAKWMGQRRGFSADDHDLLMRAGGHREKPAQPRSGDE